MAHVETHSDAPQANLRPMGNAFMLISAIAFVGSLAMVLNGNKEFAQSYLYAYVVGATAVLGALGLVLLHHCVRGSWGLSVLRLFEAGSSPAALFYFLVMFAPIAIATQKGLLYTAWTNPEEHFIGFKAFYHTPWFFIVRTVLLFFFWIIVSWILRASSKRQDTNQNDRERAFRTNLASPMLVLYMLSVTLWTTDWVMSLDPHWFSAIYGVLFAMSAVLSALSLGTIIVLSNRNKKPYCDIITPQLTKDLGNLLFTFTMLWAYMSLSQWLIMWMGNLPEFIKYYTERNGMEGLTAMGKIGAASIIVGFCICWSALLFPRVKRDPKMLLTIAWLIFLTRIPDLYYHVMGFMRPGTGINLFDLLALLGPLCGFIGMVGFQSGQASLYPEHDQRLKEAASNHHG